MTRILAHGLGFPEHVVSQAAMIDRVGAWLSDSGRDPRRIQEILARSGVEQRYAAVPLEEVFHGGGFEERTERYALAATELAERAVREALDQAGLDAERIGLVTVVSCTGFMIPSIDAHLANRLPLSTRVRRMPLTLLGCAGGAIGLSHTHDWLRAHPRELALLIAVEIASQSFQRDDFSMAHLVSCALFGDGAAACLLAGAEAEGVPSAGRCDPHVVASRSRLFANTLEFMGFDVRDSGFHMVLDAGIPRFLAEEIWPEVELFLHDHGTTIPELDHFLIHPGGRRILDELEPRLPKGALELSRTVLREYGNLSSASVLVLLQHLAATASPRPGQRGLLVAFGPGFHAEMLLLEWGQAC